MGVSEPQEICEEAYQRPPGWSIKAIQAETIQDFVGIYPLGLFRSDGYGYAAVGERQRKILRFVYAHTPAGLPFILKILIFETFCFAVIIRRPETDITRRKMGSGINEIALIALIAFAIFFIPRMRAGKRQEITFVKPAKKTLAVHGRVRLAIFLSILWIIAAAFFFEPWNKNLITFCYIGAGPVLLGWGLIWVAAGYKKYRR